MTRYIDTAETAKLIRARLKAEFPKTKFSVRISRYAGGSSIYVNWTDGPTSKRVNQEIGGFNNTHFDGMIDMSYSSSSWLTKDGRAIWGGTRGTQGSAGVVPAVKVEPTPPEEGAELVYFSGSLSTSRQISTAFAKKLVQQIGAYWGGVQYWPEFKEPEPSWGYSITVESDRTPRDDLGTHKYDHYWSWSGMIRRAAEDRTEFTREEIKDPAQATERLLQLVG